MTPHARHGGAAGFLITLLLANLLFASTAFGQSGGGGAKEVPPVPAQRVVQAPHQEAPKGKGWKRALLAVGAGIATVAIVVFTRDPKPPTIVVGPPSVGQP